MHNFISHSFSMLFKRRLLLAITLVLAGAVHYPASAQGLDRETAVDAIIGSSVKTDEVRKDSDIARVVVAIENSLHSAELARKAFSLDSLEIIFVPEINDAVAKAIADNESDISVLRESIEGSAMFYHAIDSRSIMLNNIIAAEFVDANDVTIFIKGTSDTADRNIEVPAIDN